ncbi:MAG: hypothetical protein IPJ40_00030 [Saprospirales bacterium]|nr:hypothetical protein [Saprospirales bacterium]
MTIQRKNDQIIITLPASVDIEGVQRLINFLLFKEAVKDSKAKQEDVDQLARDVNKTWWKRINTGFAIVKFVVDTNIAFSAFSVRSDVRFRV